MPSNRIPDVELEAVKITATNFTGRIEPMNEDGEKNFLCILPRDVAHDMLNDGWNVKQFNPDSDGNEGDYFIRVAVSYKIKNPIIKVIQGGRIRELLKEDELSQLDGRTFLNVDLAFEPYVWTYRATGKTGVKAMLTELYVTIKESNLSRKYAQFLEEEDND